MKHFLVVIFFAAALVAEAQAPFTFSKRYEGSGDDEYTCVIPVSGGYFAAGYTWGAPYGGIVTKFDSTGTAIWSKTVGTTRINRCAQSASGMYYVAGENSVSSNPNFHLAKLDASGTVLWAKSFGKTGEPDVLRDMRLTSDGGCLLSGYADTTAGAGFTPIAYIIKTDSSGNLQWSKYVGGAQGEEFYVAKELSTGGYLACGYTHSYGSQVGNENYLVKFDASGNALWKQVFGHSSRFDFISDFIETQNGFLVTGNCTYGSATDNAFLARTDASGNMMWIKTYSTGAGTSHLLKLSDGNLLLAGYNTSAALGIYNNSYLMKTDTSGNLIWAREYGLPLEDDRLLSARQTSDGGFILSGSVYNNSTILRSALLVKTDAAGVSGCRDTSWAVTVTNLPVSSTSGGNTVNVSYNTSAPTSQLSNVLTAYAYCANTSLGSAEIAEQEISIAPNPAHDQLQIKRNSNNSLRYEIIDLSGRILYANPSATGDVLNIDVSSLSPGMYFIRYTSAQNCRVVRFVKK